MAEFDDFDEGHSHPWDETDEIESLSKPEYDMMPQPHVMTESEILSMQIQDGAMAVLGKNGRFALRDLEGDRRDVDLSVRQPHKVFLDLSAAHCFVSTLDGEMHYINAKTGKSTKFSVTATLSGGTGRTAQVVVESVAFDRLNSDDTSTGVVFLGARNDGFIFSVSLSAGVVNHCRQLEQIPNEASPISGLEQELIGHDEESGRLMLIATCASKLYRYIAPPGASLEEFIAKAKAPSSITERPSTMRADGGGQGTLSVFRSSPESSAHSYAWCSSVGVVHGLFYHPQARVPTLDDDLDAFDDDEDDEDDETGDKAMRNGDEVPFNRQQRTDSGFDRAPLAVLHTAFHLCLLYDDRFIVLWHPCGLRWRPINGAEFRECDFAERCRLDPFKFRNTRNFRGMVRDVKKRRIYVYNHQSIFELSIKREHLGAWKLFLERALDQTEEKAMRKRCFSAAMRLAETPHQRDLVAYAHGCFSLDIRDYGTAMRAFAVCNRFEDVVFKLKTLRNATLLHDYVQLRYRFLRRFRQPGTQQTQLACLVTMLAQLKLEGLSRAESDRTKAFKKTRELRSFIKGAVSDSPQTFEDRAFYNVIARLFTSHGRIDVMLFYAELMRHVHYTINYYIAQKDYARAAELLRQYCTGEQYRDAWYDFAPLIIPHCPAKLIDGMLRCTFRDVNNQLWSHLDPERLIPTFINYAPTERDPSTDEVIKYLDTAIRTFNCESPTVHNYLVSVLVQCQDFRPLEAFLKESEFYTTEYALRRCLEARRFQQCVPLYCRLRLYTDAVQIALEGRPNRDGVWEGLETAKALLKDPDLDLDYPKKKELWKMVVLRVVDTLDTRAALSIIYESDKIIKLEDIIDRISDSTVIQDFKQDICNSLKEYTIEIEQLQEQMRHANVSSELIKADILALRHRYGYVTPSQKCLLCHKPLLSSANPFFVYPSCSHAFHEDCVVMHLERLGGLETFLDTDVPAMYMEGCHTVEDLAASECVLCGEAAILGITEPFFDTTCTDTSWDTS